MIMFLLGVAFGLAIAFGWKLGTELFLRLDFWIRRKRGKTCGFDQSCRRPATFDAKAEAYQDDQKVGKSREFKICEHHTKVLTKMALKARDYSGTVEYVTKDGKDRKMTFDNRVCEEGYDHSDDPDWTPGHLHSHLDFGDADMSVLKPEPLDPITAAIEAAYKNKKGSDA